MRIISKRDISKDLLNEIKNGAVFIYPTDTIYGIGCNAMNSSAVKRIRELKSREEKPFSVIAPSKAWIRLHAKVSKKYLHVLPGKFTLIVPLKDRAVSSETNGGAKTLGVRIPKHWISKLTAKIKIPIITTSVNLSGKPNAKTLSELKKFKVDFIIYEGKKEGIPSTIVNTMTKEIKKRTK